MTETYTGQIIYTVREFYSEFFTQVFGSMLPYIFSGIFLLIFLTSIVYIFKKAFVIK